MIHLLKIYFYISRKMLFTVFIIIILALSFSFYFSDSINMNIFIFIFTAQLSTLGMSFLDENFFIKRMRTMPISPKVFIKSIFVYGFILSLLLVIPASILAYYSFTLGKVELYEFYLLLGLFTVSISTLGANFINYFQYPAKRLSNFSGWFFVLNLICFMIPHLLLVFFLKLPFESFSLSSFIMPFICLFVYFKQYQIALVHYENAEF